MNGNGTIKIGKGLDIRVPGTAAQQLAVADHASYYAVTPSDCVGVSPRMLVAEGDSVMVGTPLFVDKNNEAALFVSPVSGTVQCIVRGERRALQAVVVASDGNLTALDNKPFDLASATADSLAQWMSAHGLWTLLRQRPFGVVPAIGDRPKALFISAFDSSPLAVDYDFLLKERKEDFQKGLDALVLLAGKVHLSLHERQRDSWLARVKGVEVHYFDGPHPAGLVGTHIACFDPINKGERVWTLEAQQVAVLGRSLCSGGYDPHRVVAVCGPSVAQPQYYRLLAGAPLSFIPQLLSQPAKGDAVEHRCICGDILSGLSASMAVDSETSLPAGYLGAGVSKVCILPEGNYYDFMGWLRPNFRKYSFSHIFLSGFFNRCKRSACHAKWQFDTGRHGDKRPLFVTGQFEKLTPLDIYPMQLIKACVVGDIELMEELGIYEVEPEDLALCEFADTSKTEIQSIVRNALEKIRKEG